MIVKREFILFLSFAILTAGCGESPREKVSVKEAPGEFTYRMEMAKERLTTGRYLPVYTPEFILADVNINPDIQKHPYMMITMQFKPE